MMGEVRMKEMAVRGGEDEGDGREGRFFIRIDVSLGIRFSGVVHLLKFFGFDLDLSRVRGSERWR